MNLFKYYTLNLENLSAIKKKTAWFSEPSYFNDPFDCQLRLRCLHDELFLKKTAEYMSIEKQCKIDSNWLRREVGNIKDKSEDINEESNYVTPGYAHIYYDSISRFNLNIKDYNKFILDSFPTENSQSSEIRTFITTIMTTGVACFSMQGSDPKMWAHYADEHRGFCVKYSLREEELPQGVIAQLVKYESKPLEDNKVYGAFDRETILDHMCFKHDVWIHESEVRLISFLNGSGLKELPINLEMLCFGYAMPQDKRDFIQDYLGLEVSDLRRAIPNRATMRISWEIIGGFAEKYED